MSELNIQPNMGTPGPEERKRRKWIILILFLFLFMMMTTGFVGYILGKSSRFSDDMHGKAIDTIHITQSEARVHLGGKIFYSDGTPYAGGIIQLHSEPRQTVTDDTGAFVFDNAEGGSHTVSILDEAGNVLAETKVNISKEDIKEGASVQLLNNEAYQVDVAMDIKFLEVQLEIDKESGKLYINPDKVTYLTEDGIVVSPTGKADIKNGIIVTPMGTVITTDGTIICGSGENDNKKVIISSGGLNNKEDGSIQAPDGTTIRPDGTIMYKDTVIDTSGVSMNSNGSKLEPGEGGYQILEDDNNSVQMPLGKDTEERIGNNSKTLAGENQRTDENDTGRDNPASGTQGTNTPSDNNQGTSDTNIPVINDPVIINPGNNNWENNNSGTDNPGTDTPEPDNPNKPDDTKPDDTETDYGVQFAGGTSEQQLKAWIQATEIDLFYNRTAGEDDVTLLAPGAEGYYLFRVNNDNNFSIAIDLAVSEKSLHLPLEFAIADISGNLLTSWTWATEKAEVYTDKITLKNRGQEIYQIKWRWPYYTSETQDAEDTRIGKLDERSYTVDLYIRAEQR